MLNSLRMNVRYKSISTVCQDDFEATVTTIHTELGVQQ